MNAEVKPILVAVDGSQPSNWALRAAARLATRMDALLILLHVIALRKPGASDLALETSVVIQYLREEGDEVLQAACRQLPPGLIPRMLLVEGNPAQQIIAQAQAIDVEFILMGNRDRGRWARSVLGSTAETVLRDAPCPVIVVSHALRSDFETEVNVSPQHNATA